MNPRSGLPGFSIGNDGVFRGEAQGAAYWNVPKTEFDPDKVKRAVVAEDDPTAVVWEFARQFARTSGDSPDCQCVSCRAYRAVAAVDSCPGCDGPISLRYAQHGVCRDCYNTTDDPGFPR